MSVGSNVVKITAKNALKDNFLKASIACLILVFTWLICVNSAGLLSYAFGNAVAELFFVLLAIFLVLPVFLGVLRYIWRMLHSVTDNPVAVFYWFSEKALYVKAIRFILQYALRIALWFAILNIPSLLLFALSKSFIFDFVGTSTPLWTANLEYYSVLLRNISWVLVFFITLKFYLAPILLIADENMDINEAMYLSSVISRKSSIDFIGLIFSSAGWILLSVFVLPLIFTLPLLLGFYTVHGRFAVTEYNCHIKQSESDSTEFVVNE